MRLMEPIYYIEILNVNAVNLLSVNAAEMETEVF